MTLVVWSVAIGAIAALAAWIAAPVLRPPDGEEPADEALIALIARREAVVALLRDLEADRADGRIDEADFEALRAPLVAEGTAILAALDAFAGRGHARVEADLAGAERPPCRGCGRRPTPGDRYCAACGQSLPEEAW